MPDNIQIKIYFALPFFILYVVWQSTLAGDAYFDIQAIPKYTARVYCPKLKYVVWQYTLVRDASCSQLESCRKLIIYSKILPITKHFYCNIPWWVTVGDASFGRLRSCRKIYFYTKILDISDYVLWEYTLADDASCSRLQSCRKLIIHSKILAITEHFYCNIPWRVTLIFAD